MTATANTIAQLRTSGWDTARNDRDSTTWLYPPTDSGEVTSAAEAEHKALRAKGLVGPMVTNDEGAPCCKVL